MRRRRQPTQSVTIEPFLSDSIWAMTSFPGSIRRRDYFDGRHTIVDSTTVAGRALGVEVSTAVRRPRAPAPSSLLLTHPAVPPSTEVWIDSGSSWATHRRCLKPAKYGCQMWSFGTLRRVSRPPSRTRTPPCPRKVTCFGPAQATSIPSDDSKAFTTFPSIVCRANSSWEAGTCLVRTNLRTFDSRTVD